MPKTTEQIDKLFLELSQFTQAKTAREIALEAEARRRLDEMVAVRDRLRCLVDKMEDGLLKTNLACLNNDLMNSIMIAKQHSF